MSYRSRSMPFTTICTLDHMRSSNSQASRLPDCGQEHDQAEQQNSHQARIAEKSYHLARGNLRDLLAKLDQPVGVYQRRQQASALTGEFCDLEPAVVGLVQIDPHIFAAGDLLFISE